MCVRGRRWSLVADGWYAGGVCPGREAAADWPAGSGAVAGKRAKLAHAAISWAVASGRDARDKHAPSKLCTTRTSTEG